MATDPRDKVFAVLGLSSDSESLNLHADYRRTCADTYISLAARLIEENYIEVLSICDHKGSGIKLPSWVPDWSRSSRSSSLQGRGLHRWARPIVSCLLPDFSAGGSKLSMHTVSPGNANDNVMLHLSGRLLGKIEQVGMIWKDGGMGRWLRDLDTFADLVHSDSDKFEERKIAVIRTAVGDQELIKQGTFRTRLAQAEIDKVRQSMDGKQLDQLDMQDLVRDGLGEYCKQLAVVARARRPFLISGGYFGIGSCDVEVGYSVYVIHGAGTPYVFRLDPKKEQLRLLGEAYIHGIMDGEAMDVLKHDETILVV